MITEVRDNEIFVFGSNLLGHHAGGAALQAKRQFGAREGVAEGLTGQCYAFPTLGIGMGKRMPRGLKTSVKKFYAVARANPHKRFLMTPVGTGIAGYAPVYMASLFKNPPANVVLPDWYHHEQ